MDVKAPREAGPVLERLELRLAVGVVGGGVGPVVGLGDAEVGEQEGDGLGGHRAAAVGVHGQRARLDLLLLAGLGDQVLGDVGVLAVLDGPADGVAAEDVEDHVEVEVRPFRGAEQLGDVPGLDLVGARRRAARACCRRDACAGRGARGPGRARRPAAGTSCARRRDSGPRRAASPRPARASCRRSARCAARPGPRRARPADSARAGTGRGRAGRGAGGRRRR